MMSKKGIQLSFNMIITVILGLVFLGVAITLIYNWIPDIPPYPNGCDIYPPTSDKPVCIGDKLEMKRGETVNLKVAFYNDEDNEIDDSNVPEIVCNPNIDDNELELKTNSMGNTLPIGESIDYAITVQIPKDAPKESFICKISLSETEKQFSIEII